MLLFEKVDTDPKTIAQKLEKILPINRIGIVNEFKSFSEPFVPIPKSRFVEKRLKIKGRLIPASAINGFVVIHTPKKNE